MIAYLLAPAITAKAVYGSVNAERVLHHERPLVTNVALTRVALDKARDMNRFHYFAHVRTEKNKDIDLEYFLNVEKYPYVEGGENLAINYSSVSALVQAWMNSPTHRANILNDHYTDTGIAIGRENGEVAVTQMFGATK